MGKKVLIIMVAVLLISGIYRVAYAKHVTVPEMILFVEELHEFAMNRYKLEKPHPYLKRMIDEYEYIDSESDAKEKGLIVWSCQTEETSGIQYFVAEYTIKAEVSKVVKQINEGIFVEVDNFNFPVKAKVKWNMNTGKLVEFEIEKNGKLEKISLDIREA
jgi:hypothetical protein